MKKFTFIQIYLLISAFTYGQSVIIVPSGQTIESTTFDNIHIKANNLNIGILSQRFNGAVASKSAVINGDRLFNLSAGGFYNSSSTHFDVGLIRFDATENWSIYNGGTKMRFFTTPNGSTANAERMVIDHNGSVGIGAISPITKFDVLENTGFVGAFRSTTSQSYIAFYKNTLDYTGYMGTYNDPANNSIEISTGAGNTTGSVYLATSTVPRLTITPTGFIKLGDNASTPAIKTLELSGTTSNTNGGFIDITHGLTQSKILSVSVFVNATTGNDMPPRSSFANFEYDFFVGTTSIVIKNVTGNDLNIRNRPVRILVTYKE